MILRLCIILHFIKVVFTTNIDSGEITDSQIEDVLLSDVEIEKNHNLDHTRDMSQSEDMLIAEGKGKSINLHF